MRLEYAQRLKRPGPREAWIATRARWRVRCSGLILSSKPLLVCEPLNRTVPEETAGTKNQQAHQKACGNPNHGAKLLVSDQWHRLSPPNAKLTDDEERAKAVRIGTLG